MSSQFLIEMLWSRISQALVRINAWIQTCNKYSFPFSNSYGMLWAFRCIAFWYKKRARRRSCVLKPRFKLQYWQVWFQARKNPLGKFILANLDILATCHSATDLSADVALNIFHQFHWMRQSVVKSQVPRPHRGSARTPQQPGQQCLILPGLFGGEICSPWSLSSTNVNDIVFPCFSCIVFPELLPILRFYRPEWVYTRSLDKQKQWNTWSEYMRTSYTCHKYICSI